jgi:MATE family multidrug resistance protein
MLVVLSRAYFFFRYSALLLGGAPSWLGRVVDTEEARAQLRFAVPVVVMSMAYSAIPLVSVLFSGHLGDVHLASATLGVSWATVTGYAFLVRIICTRQ